MLFVPWIQIDKLALLVQRERSGVGFWRGTFCTGLQTPDPCRARAPMTRRIEWNGGYGAPEESMKRRRVASEVVARGGSYVQSGGPVYTRRCYVGNLAWHISWQELKDAFRPCGNIVYANVTREDDGRSAGWGIVEFETPAEAANAIQMMNNVDLGEAALPCAPAWQPGSLGQSTVHPCNPCAIHIPDLHVGVQELFPRCETSPTM